MIFNYFPAQIKHILPTVINVKEDYVDKIIETMDGRIKREKGPMYVALLPLLISPVLI